MLPDSVLAESGGVPQAEDIALELLRRRLPGLHVTSLIEQDQPMPFVLVRAVSFQGAWSADPRFVRDYYISADSFTSGLESDVEGPLIHLAIENVLRKAALAHDPVMIDRGWVEEMDLIEPARRVADWANSEGPVQYADLPQGTARFTSIYRLQIKRAEIGPHTYSH